jgi:hypothetical protein
VLSRSAAGGASGPETAGTPRLLVPRRDWTGWEPTPAATAERSGQLGQRDRYFAAATIAHEYIADLHRELVALHEHSERTRQLPNLIGAEFARGRPRARRAPAASGFAHRKGRRRGTHVASSTASPLPSMLPRVRTAPRARSSQRSAKPRRSGASRDAPREIRTPTVQTGHKALNLAGGVPVLQIALHLLDLQPHLREVAILRRRGIRPREVPFVERLVEDREHQPHVALLEVLETDAFRRPHVGVVEQGARRTQHGHASLITAQAPTHPQKVLDPVARLMHHHTHRVMAVNIRDHRRASLITTCNRSAWAIRAKQQRQSVRGRLNINVHRAGASLLVPRAASAPWIRPRPEMLPSPIS